MRFLLVSLSLCLFFPKASAEEFYGAYGLYPQGSTRVSAMGGAFVALSDDISGTQHNAAGLAMTESWGLLGGNGNIVLNREVDLDNDAEKKKDGLPYYYANYAAALRLGRVAFGLGVSSPYNIDLEFTLPDGSGFEDKRKLRLSILSADFPVAYRFADHWALGVVLHAETLDESYTKVSTNPATTQFDVKAQKQVGSATWGLIYRPSKTWGFGLSHTPERTFILENTAGLNAQTDGISWFKSVRIPSKTVLGGFMNPWPPWIFVLDVDYYSTINDAVYVGSELISGFKRVEIDPTPKITVHGGLEYHFVKTWFWDLYFRLGSYNEPARLKNAAARQHTTLGFEIRVWAFTFGFSADTIPAEKENAQNGPDFVNYSAGLGLSLSPFDIF